MENISNRLQFVLGHYRVTASDFAEKIGVGRSSISHLLSGRNKPSLDLILKMIKAYPEINLYWLLEGGKQNAFIQEDNERKNEKNKKERFSTIDSSHRKGKEISRIVIFYNDGSFESFQNEDKIV